MDYNSMKRKELQALCKKHKIPANLSNLEMSKRLTELLKGDETVQDENVSETELNNVVVNRIVKKVRFSPEHEMIEFTRSVQVKRRSRRGSVLGGNSTLPVEIVDNKVVNVDMEVGVNENEKKRGRKGVNRNGNVDVVENCDDGELKKGGADGSLGRGMRLRGKTIVKTVVNASKRGVKRVKCDDKASDKADNDELAEEIVGGPGRVTRSRNQKLTGAPTGKENVALASTVDDDNGVVTRRSTRNRRVVNNGKSVENNGKLSDDKKAKEVHVLVEPQNLLRRSKRNVNVVTGSEMMDGDIGKHEIKVAKGSKKTPMLLTVESSGVDEETSESLIHPDRKLEVVPQQEESNKLEPRRSNRRKFVMPNTELKSENEDRCTLRSSVSQSETAVGVCKDEEKVLQPARVTRMSRNKTSILKSVSTDEKLDTVAEGMNFETEKHISIPCRVENKGPVMNNNTRRSRKLASNKTSLETIDESAWESNIQLMNETKKRKISPSSEGDVMESKNDPNSPIQSVIKASGNKKATPDAEDNLAAKSGLRERNLLNSPTRESLLEVGESLSDAQQAVSETTTNQVLSSNPSAKNIITDIGLTMSRKSLRKKQRSSIADSGGTSVMKLINSTELANSEKIAQSRTGEMETDTDRPIENSATELGDVVKVCVLEFGAPEENEENISDVGKTESETDALVFSQNDDSSHHNRIDTMVLPEDSNVPEDTGVAETNSLDDIVSIGDLIDSETNPVVTEDEADKYTQPSLHTVDNVGKVDGGFVQTDLDSVEPGHANETILPISCTNKVEISERTTEGRLTKAGEAEVYLHSAASVRGSQLQEPSAVKLKKSIECYNTAEEDSGINSQLSDTDEYGRLKDHKNYGEDSELCLSYLFDEERSGIIPQHNRIFSGKSSVMDSEEHGVSKRSSTVSPTSRTNSPNSPIQSMIDSSRSKKGMSADVIESVSAKRTPPSRLDKENLLDTPSREVLLETEESLFSNAQLAASGTTRTQILSSNSSAKSIVSGVGLLSSRKTLRKKQCSSSAVSYRSGDTKLINANEFVSLAETAESNTDTDCGKENSACKLGEVEMVHSLLEPDVQDETQENISDAVNNEPNPILFSPTKDSVEVLREGSDLPENAGYTETCSSDDSISSGDQVDFEINLDITGDEADKNLQPGLEAVAQVCEVKCVFVEENTDSIEPGHTNEMRLSNELNHKDEISETNNEDAVPNAGETGAFESCDVHIHSTDSKSEVVLKDPSSGKPSKSLQGDNTAEPLTSKLAETGEGDCLKDYKNTDEDGEYNLSYLFDGEKSARIVPHYRGIFSAEDSTMESVAQGISKDSLAINPITVCVQSTEIKQKIGVEADDIATGNDTQVDNTIPEFVKTGEGDPSKDQMSKCDEVDDFNVYNLFDEDCLKSSDKNVIKDSDEQRVFHDSPTAAPLTMSNGSEIMVMRDHEANHTTEGEVTSVAKNTIIPESAESDEGGCSKDQKSSKDEDWDVNASDLFDSGKSVRMTPRDRRMSSENSVMGFDKQGLHNSPAVSTMCVNLTDVHCGAVSYNLQERGPSEPNSVSKSQGSLPTSFDIYNIPGNKDIDQEKEVSNSESKIPTDELFMERTVSNEEHASLIQGDVHSNRDTYEPAEPLIGPSSPPTVIANTIEGQDAWSGGSETAGSAMSIFKTNDKRKASEMLEGSEANTIQEHYAWSGGSETAGSAMSILKTNDNRKASEMVADSDNLENDNDANCGKDKEGFDDARISDKEISMDYSRLRADSNSKDLLVTNTMPDAEEAPTDLQSSRSWTEIELDNLFRTTDDNVIPTVLNDYSCQGAGIINLTVSMNKSSTNSDGSLTKRKKKETEGQQGDECAASNVGGEENELKLLFKTPIKVVGICKDDETFADDETLKNEVFFKSEENMGVIASEVENSLCLRHSLPSNAENTTDGEMNEVQNVELVNAAEVDLQRSNSHICYADVNILREASVYTSDIPVDPEISKTGSYSGQKDAVFDNGTPSSTFSEASHCDYEFTERKHGKSIIKDDRLYSGKVFDNTDDKLTSCHEILDVPRTSKEVDNVVLPTERISSDCGAEFATLSSLEMHLRRGDDGGDNIGKSEAETSFFNLEEKLVNFNNDVIAVSDEPASGCNKILKESDVEDTIREYIDSESSMSVEFEEPEVLMHVEENAALGQLGESADDINGILPTTEGKDDTDTESKELEEAMMVVKPAHGSMEAMKSPACSDMVHEGSTAGVDGNASVVDGEGKELEEAKKNSRTILIHGTPRKVLAMTDMKENEPRNKSSHIGDFTTRRPAKRRKALQDVQWK